MGPTQDETFAPGARFGAYQIVRALGKGASGAVYEVLKTAVNKRMALKVLHRALAQSQDDLVRFGREAVIVGALEHPNIVQVFDVGEVDGYCFMTMELLEGETLEDKLRREGTLAVRELCDLFVPLMSALAAVHERGIVHRDLKPGNIFLVSRRAGVVEPKLLDFGVVKDLTGTVGGDITKAHAMVGSPSYMSPEQAERAHAIDARSDQFTVGAILWECLVGRKLFDGDSLYHVLYRIAEEPITSPRALRADVPAALDALIMRALERDPDRRFASPRDIGAGLLLHCSEHVRAVWRDELLAGAADESQFEDEVTSMIPVASQALALRAIGPLHAPPSQPYAAAPPAATSSAPPSPPLPVVSLPQTPSYPQHLATQPAPRFQGAATFQPTAVPAQPPRAERSPWLVLVAVFVLAGLALTAVVMLRREPVVAASPVQPPHAAQQPVVTPPSAPGVRAPLQPVAQPLAPDAGGATAQPTAPHDDHARLHPRRSPTAPK